MKLLSQVLGILFVMFATHFANAQSIIRGIVVDAKEKPISGVQVNENGTKRFAESDYNGEFTLRISSSESVLVFEHTEYVKLEKNVKVSEYQKIFLTLTENGNPTDLGNFSGAIDFSRKLKGIEWENLPYLLGEADVNRKIQMLPGIEQGSEGFSNLYVRGGNADQNLYMYNDIPIYNYNHGFGITSTFNRHGLEDVEIQKGISPAKNGGRLSSVILLKPKNQDQFKKVSGSFEASLLTGCLYVQSVTKNNGFWSVAARRSWLDLLFPTEFRENNLNLNFHDIQVNYSQKLDDKNELNFTFINSRTYALIGFQDSSATKFTNYRFKQRYATLGGGVKLHQAINKKLQASHQIFISRYKNTSYGGIETLDSLAINPLLKETDNINGIMEVGAKTDFTYFRDNKHTINFGLQTSQKMYRLGYTKSVISGYTTFDTEEQIAGSLKYSNALETAFYAEDNLRLNKNTTLNLGLRNVFYSYNGSSSIKVEPRFNLSHTPKPRVRIKLAYNNHNQFVHLLTTGGTGSSDNLWVPATAYATPSSSHIGNFSYERILSKNWSISGNAYYKRLSNILIVNSLFQAIDPENDWQSQVSIGSGQAYGLELLASFTKDKNALFASYTYSKSTRTFEDLYTDPFLFGFDRPHFFKFSYTNTADDFIQFGANVLLGSGQLFTVPTGRYLDYENNYVLEYNTLNNYRSNYYQRVDINLSLNYELGTWRFGVYNFLLSKNPSSIDPLISNTAFKQIKLERTYIFRFIPSISYGIKF